MVKPPTEQVQKLIHDRRTLKAQLATVTDELELRKSQICNSCQCLHHELATLEAETVELVLAVLDQTSQGVQIYERTASAIHAPAIEKLLEANNAQ